MKSLSSEDKTKLHNEINQTLNQRFVLATTGITVFGLFSAFLVPKGDIAPSGAELNLLYVGATFMLVFLGLLVYWASTLQNVMNMLGQYLLKCNASDWEKDVEQLFTGPIPHRSFYIGRVFFFLGFASSCWPLLIEAAAFAGHIDWALRHIALVSALCLYFAFWYWAVFVRPKRHKQLLSDGWNLILGLK